jgi:hypothetical protein
MNIEILSYFLNFKIESLLRNISSPIIKIQKFFINLINKKI